MRRAIRHDLRSGANKLACVSIMRGSEVVKVSEVGAAAILREIMLGWSRSTGSPAASPCAGSPRGGVTRLYFDHAGQVVARRCGLDRVRVVP